MLKPRERIFEQLTQIFDQDTTERVMEQKFKEACLNERGLSEKILELRKNLGPFVFGRD